MKKFIFWIFIILFIHISPAFSQITLSNDLNEINYANPKEYEIGGITVSGVQYLDNNILTMLSGLTVGEKIKVPGEKITKSCRESMEPGIV